MKKDNYESLIQELLAKAQPVNHNRSPCEKDFIEKTLPEVSIIFLWSKFIAIFFCQNLWQFEKKMGGKIVENL